MDLNYCESKTRPWDIGLTKKNNQNKKNDKMEKYD